MLHVNKIKPPRRKEITKDAETSCDDNMDEDEATHTDMDDEENSLTSLKVLLKAVFFFFFFFFFFTLHDSPRVGTCVGNNGIGIGIGGHTDELNSRLSRTHSHSLTGFLERERNPITLLPYYPNPITLILLYPNPTMP